MSVDTTNLTAAQIRALQSQLSQNLAEREDQEKADLVANIKAQVSKGGYDLNEIIDLLVLSVEEDQAKYQHPNDPTLNWSGRGRMPNWLHNLIKLGHSKSEFLK